MICDCQKELENEITHYRRVVGKLKKIRWQEIMNIEVILAVLNTIELEVEIGPEKNSGL